MPSDPTIRLVHLSSSVCIGEKRNVGCGMARGSIIVHWDDDDWSAPGRVEDQIGRMMDGDKACTGYHTMRFTDGNQWWLYSGAASYALGTSMCHTKAWWQANPFANVDTGEDDKFSQAAWTAGQLITADAGNLMWASIHSGNTSPRQLEGERWKRL